MHQLIPEGPLEAVDELQYPTRILQIPICGGGGLLVEGEVVDVDVEVDSVGEVVRGGEGAEAAGEGVEAVEGEDFDNESESGCSAGGAKSEVRVRVPGSEDGDGGRIEVGVVE